MSWAGLQVQSQVGIIVDDVDGTKRDIIYRLSQRNPNPTTHPPRRT